MTRSFTMQFLHSLWTIGQGEGETRFGIIDSVRVHVLKCGMCDGLITWCIKRTLGPMQSLLSVPPVNTAREIVTNTHSHRHTNRQTGARARTHTHTHTLQNNHKFQNYLLSSIRSCFHCPSVTQTISRASLDFCAIFSFTWIGLRRMDQQCHN